MLSLYHHERSCFDVIHDTGIFEHADQFEMASPQRENATTIRLSQSILARRPIEPMPACVGL